MEQLEEKQLARLKQLLSLLEPDVLTKEDFLKNFEGVINHIKSFEQKTVEQIEAIHKTLTAFNERLKKEASEGIENEKATLKQLVSEQLEVLTGKLAEVDAKIATVKDGKDADAQMIVEEVLTELKLPEYKEVTLDSPEEIRNKLEVLQGDERLDKSAIRGLQEEVEELKRMILARPAITGGARGKTPILKKYNLTSQCDGVTKAFTLPIDTTDVIGVFGTQFPVQFDPSNDWSFSGRTLTLGSGVAAPETGQTLWALIEVLFN